MVYTCLACDRCSVGAGSQEAEAIALLMASFRPRLLSKEYLSFLVSSWMVAPPHCEATVSRADRHKVQV